MTAAAIKNAAALIYVGKRAHIGPKVLRNPPRAVPLPVHLSDVLKLSLGGLAAMLGGAPRGAAASFKTSTSAANTATTKWVNAHHPALRQALLDERALLLKKKAELARWDVMAKANFVRYFGAPPSEPRRAIIQARVEKELQLNREIFADPTYSHFRDDTIKESNVFAWVHPGDRRHTMFLSDLFRVAPATGQDSRAGTLAHEMSHFTDVGKTLDYTYGLPNALRIAQLFPDFAIMCADNFEYYLEDAR